MKYVYFSFSACDNIFNSVSKSENHMCQLQSDAFDCSGVICAASITLDTSVYVINIALQFDSCAKAFHIQAEGGYEYTLAFNGKRKS